LSLEKRSPSSRSVSVFRSHDGELEYLAAYEDVLKLWPVPYEEVYVPTRLGDTHIIASGPAEAFPLVLLHPSGSPATIWYRSVGALSERYRTYAVDTIGEPNKSVLARPINGSRQREDFGEWMADLFDGLRIGKAHVVGNSFGGFLALNTVLRLPERVEKAVLISPAATFVQMCAWYWHFVPAGMLGPLIRSKRLLLRPYEWIWQGFPVDEHTARLRVVTALEGRPRHSFPSVFSDEELSKIRTPILLLVPDHEVIYKPERVIQRASSAVAGLKAKIIPNANHNAEYTAPDAVSMEILSFLLNP
jgi:pimeloyl-ACP methyl ester carboxylesterase